MFSNLLRTRRFAPLFWCQFLSSFNDNFVRQMLAMMILFRLGDTMAGPLIMLAVGLFILPSFFLSGLGGELADSRDKAWLAQRLKAAEIGVQMIAAAGFWFASLPLLYTALFGLGIIAALFGPLKYGILPDHLKSEELPSGNALVEGATFFAILLGLMVGGYAASHDREPVGVVIQLMMIAIACWFTSRFIPATGAAAPHLKVDWNVFASTLRILRELKSDRRAWIGGVTVSWFWMVGAIVVSLMPIIIKTRMSGGIEVETAVSALFAIGIAAGSITAAVLSHGRITLILVPLAGLVMALVLFDLTYATAILNKPSAELGLQQFFTDPNGLHIALAVMVFAFAGGVFVVPIFSAVQLWAGEDRRARVIAGVNILNALFIVGGTLLVAVLQLAGISDPTILAFVGIATALFSLWFWRQAPTSLTSDLLRLIFRIVYRLEVRGVEHLPKQGTPCIIALNHVSFLDAPVILSLLDEKPVFAIDWQIARLWWVRPFLGIARCFPMDPSKPLSMRGLIKEVREGQRLVILPEGRLTVTGSLMKVYDGTAMIADKSDAVIVPVRLEGLERTPFTRLSSTQVRRTLFPKVRVTFLAPRKLHIDETLFGRKRRLAAGAGLYDIMSDLMFQTTSTDKTLIKALQETLRETGPGKTLLEDPLTGSLTARKFRIGTAVLARRFVSLGQAGDAIGVLLPNANGVAVTFFALQQAARVPAMLNYTAGPANIRAACEAARVHHVLTSRAFIEKAALETVVQEIAKVTRIHYLEDIRAQITTSEKIRGLLDRGEALASRQPDDPAVILFTSGSEGLPKGVALSHRNILANLAQITARVDLSHNDIIFNALPVFHSFGLTGGMMLSLLTGMKLYLYPSPLHYRQIPELVYSSNATIFFGTDTFLAGYARTANPYDFRSVRLLVAGAERLKDETRQLYMERFGIRIFEGYGVTETAPVLAVNTPMFNKTDTVGRLMPGIEARIEDVPGIHDGGRLFVRGPNVMLGYYRPDNPGHLEIIADGWHDTGDIVSMDEEGYVTIKGRAKRFAKIAGEMVSLAAVEQICSGIWADDALAVVAVPDDKKGERLILVTTRVDATRRQVLDWMKEHGATELMVPSDILIVDALPLLGSGKTDYVELNRLVHQRLTSFAKA